jgi:hypothetical protein
MTKQLGYDQALSPRYMTMLVGEWEWVILGMDADDFVAIYVTNDPNEAANLGLTQIRCQLIEEYINNIIE